MKNATKTFQALAMVPRLGFTAYRFGVLPMGWSAVGTLLREGPRDIHHKVVGDALVRFCREAGPILTKAGQILATRNDFLPAPVCARLEALYSKQSPMGAREVKRLIAQTYAAGSPFEKFSYKALAVGSIGQVHRARLKSGERVIVKILRPGIEGRINADLESLAVLLDMGLSLVPKKSEGTRFMAIKLFEDLADNVRTETDLSHEMSALEEFREKFRDNPRVCVPKCFKEFCSSRVLVMEELKGTPLSTIRERAAKDPELAKRVADLALKEILRQVFNEGRFHADPHGGNLLILDDGRLGLIDLGLTGELSEAHRKSIARAVRALISRDADALMKALLEFGELPAEFDAAAFKTDIALVVSKHKSGVGARLTGREGGVGEKNSSLDAFVSELFSVAYKHRVHVPASASLLIKTLVTIEGVARGLDPELNLVAKAIPVLVESVAPKWMRGILRRTR